MDITTNYTVQFNTKIKLIFALVLLSCLFACQTPNKNSGNKASLDDLGLEERANQDKSVNHTVMLLEKGIDSGAIESINRVLRFNPKHDQARLVHTQLTKKIKQIFSTNRYYDYKVEDTDNLGSIAKTWLGNSIYFITLAQSNNIPNPALIKSGDIIKIPVLNSSPLAKQERRRSKANIALINLNMNKGKYEKALTQMSELFVLKNEHQKLIKAQIQTLSLIADQAVTIPERKETIKKIAQYKNASNRKQLLPAYQDFIREREQHIFIDEFLLLFEDKSYRDSARKLIKAKTIKGFDHNLERVIPTEKKLVNKLHEEAIIFRKKQQLDNALTSWSLILLVDSDNALAKKYHERTLKLLERLKNL